MLLYARQLAWLHAAPKRKGAKEPDKPVTRMAALNGAEPPLPPLSDGYHLIEHLMDVGPVVSNGMGMGPVSFAELLAWRSACGHYLDGWEMDTIRAMSVAFSSTLQESDSPTAPPPWSAAPQGDDRKDVARRIRDVLRG